jgi:hypothetical protein
MALMSPRELLLVKSAYVVLRASIGEKTGRLIGEMKAREAPFVDPAPYRADGFA